MLGAIRRAEVVPFEPLAGLDKTVRAAQDERETAADAPAGRPLNCCQDVFEPAVAPQADTMLAGTAIRPRHGNNRPAGDAVPLDLRNGAV